MRFRVYGEHIARISVDLEAASEQEAETAARRIFDYADKEEFEIGEELSIDVQDLDDVIERRQA